MAHCEMSHASGTKVAWALLECVSSETTIASIMKNLKYLIPVVLIAMFSCEINEVGPVGPVGPEGPQGPPGKDGEEAYTFEYTVSFGAPDYNVLIAHPESFDMLNSDMALVYFLWGQEDVDGETLDIWRALPQTLFIDQGFVQYNYDFTTRDVSLFLDADFDRSTLGSEYLDDWIVRIVVIPAQFANNGRMSLDLRDYNAVREYFNLSDPVIDRERSVQRPQ
jgi:hypothetical protein